MSLALGLIETRGYVVAIEAADAMLKAANVRLIGSERTNPALITIKIEGEVAAVKSAVDAGVSAAQRVGEVVSFHVIPAPSQELESIYREDIISEKVEPKQRNRKSKNPSIEQPEVIVEILSPVQIENDPVIEVEEEFVAEMDSEEEDEIVEIIEDNIDEIVEPEETDDIVEVVSNDSLESATKDSELLSETIALEDENPFISQLIEDDSELLTEEIIDLEDFPEDDEYLDDEELSTNELDYITDADIELESEEDIRDVSGEKPEYSLPYQGGLFDLPIFENEKKPEAEKKPKAKSTKTVAAKNQPEPEPTQPPKEEVVIAPKVESVVENSDINSQEIVDLRARDITTLNVHLLRRLARHTSNFPINGRDISKANRQELLYYFDSLSNPKP